jgi:hypothetical protein
MAATTTGTAKALATRVMFMGDDVRMLRPSASRDRSRSRMSPPFYKRRPRLTT